MGINGDKLSGNHDETLEFWWSLSDSPFIRRIPFREIVENFWLYENPVPVAGLDSHVLSKWLEYLCQEVTINKNRACFRVVRRGEITNEKKRKAPFLFEATSKPPSSQLVPTSLVNHCRKHKKTWHWLPTGDSLEVASVAIHLDSYPTW